MILDRGICRVYRKTKVSAAGEKPAWEDVLLHESYYGELNFETSAAHPTERREETRTAARIRILQNREIANHDRVELEPFDGTADPEDLPRYEVTRAWHGDDEESGEAISDLTLEIDEGTEQDPDPEPDPEPEPEPDQDPEPEPDPDPEEEDEP